MSDAHAHSVAFVRETEIPPAPPPVAETGALKWVRENLFSGPFNTIMTLLGLGIVYYLLSGLIPWIANGTWEGENIQECREILGGNGGGCFAVIADRWPQLLFGFQYPDYLRWRPSVAFLLLFIAVPPALFVMFLPRWTLAATAAYPFVAYWLIWGGTLIAPVMSALALVGGYFVFKEIEKRGFVQGMAAGVATAAVILWIGGFVTEAASGFLALEEVESRAMGGFMLNMILGTVCVSLSIPLGIALALGRQSRLPIVKGFCVLFIEFVRGVPLITLLFVANVVLAYFFPPNSNPDLIIRVIIMITMFSSAYIAEVIRGPILSSTDWVGVYWELWAFACVLFFTICYAISQYSQWLERQLTTDRH
jgi:general L-amino acid transport system permease protein